MRKTRLTAIILVIALVVSLLPISTMAAEEPWPKINGTNNMPFMPPHNYVSEQNPPNFTWYRVGGNALSYELEVYEGYLWADALDGGVAYSKSGITRNYFNMPETLTAGKYYWWRVRYMHKNGNPGAWTEARRFRIDTEAYEFTTPDIDTLLERIPQGHPRILTTPETLEEFRSYKEDNTVSLNTYKAYVTRADNYVRQYEAGTLNLKEPPYEPPEGATSAELGQYSQTYRGKVLTSTTIAMYLGYAYLLSDDTNPNKAKYAVVAKEAIKNALPTSFKPDYYGDMAYDVDHPASYKSQDQIFREISYRCAMVYDWIHETLSEEDKEYILFFIKERVEVMSGLFTRLDASPYESHGWTCFGFLGIIGVATYNEIPEAKDWLKIIIPAYTSMLPPWSYQDGGWCQGTDYWQYSTMTNHEFMDVLVLGGIIDLYKQAWVQNEYLWTLYAYPNGSYGSFGDQSNRTKASSGYSMDSVANEAYFNGNPTAKWIVESFGSKFSTTSRESYYTSRLDHIDSEPPTDYPLGHQFKDIGWVVMTDSLEDPGRLQLTFKSSFWGSFNHSHPDQNAFIIQAYGENLANKSGYYDAYHTEHDSTITRPTFAHNTITVDGGKGQLDDSIEAKGELTQFVNQMDFDSATGDATAAYRYESGNSIVGTNLTPDSGKGRLDKFVRDIIYIRPGVFVVIDDLKAYNSASGGKSSFEWWLNAEHEIEYKDNYALISEGVGRLEARVQYPAKTKATYYDGFISPIDNKHYPASGKYETYNEQRRVKFATEKVAETKMVVTMSVFKEDEEAMEVTSNVSSDGSYMELIFGDGTVCIVNLGEDNSEITYGAYTFRGDALTYNADSVLLTNGTLVKKKVGTKTQTIADSGDRMMTIAIGHNQIAFDIVGQGNDNEKETKALRIINGNENLNIASIDELQDLKGRKPSKETGFVDARVTSSAIRLWPDEGHYMFLASGSSISLEGMVPKNVALIREDQETLSVKWDQKAAYDYDIIINNSIYENVSSPYTIDIDEDESVYSIAVRAKSGSITSEWSNFVFMSSKIENTCSHVSYQDMGDTVKATVFSPNPARDILNFKLAVYDSENKLLGMYPFEIDGAYYTSTAEVPEGGKVRALLWQDEKQIKPLTAMAEFGTNNLNLKKFALDGIDYEGFSNSVDEYEISIPEGSMIMPAITAQAEDNATKVSVIHDYPNLCSYVKLIAQNGEERTITLNYKIELNDIHVVAGADDESLFRGDADRSKDKNGEYTGKISNASVGTLTWDIVKNDIAFQTSTHLASMQKSLNVYTNMAPHLSDGTTGSRLTSDRKPNSGNLTEYSNPPLEYQGYDHILFPNGNFCSFEGNYLGASAENVKANFSLSKTGEVVILTKSENDKLIEQGFERELLASSSNGRYLDAIGIEDVYYNVHILGKSKSDLTSYSLTSTTAPRLKTYEMAEDWVDVLAISGNKTVQDYIDKGYTKNNFIENSTCLRYVSTSTYKYNFAYKKVFEVVDEPVEVNIDFGDYTSSSGNAPADRMIVVVRPVTPRMPIDKFEYTGPYEFSDLTDAQKGTDKASGHSYLTHYNTLPVARVFKEDAVAFVDNSTYKITGIDPLLELEGAYFVPPHYNVAGTATNNTWMRAYYYGLGEFGGYEYPLFANTPQPMYEFDLNTDATLYVVTYGSKPAFIDDTWQCVQFKRGAFSIEGLSAKYTDVYIKHVDVEDGSSVRVSALTPGTGNTSTGTYFMIVKPKIQ